MVAYVTRTFPLVTMGDDHPRPGISADHSTFSDFPHCSASRGFVLTGFESGPRNCGQADSSPRGSPVASIMAQASPVRPSHGFKGMRWCVVMV